MKFHYTRFD